MITNSTPSSVARRAGRAGLAAFVLVWVVLLAGALARSGEDGKPDRLTDFELSDQFGARHTVAFPRSRPLLLLVGDRKGSDEVDEWIGPLKSRWGHAADILGIADVKGVPGLFRERLASSIRRSRPKPVMLDFEGTVTGALPCQRKTANLFVIDPSGRILTALAGGTNEARFASVGAVMDRLRAAPAPPAR